jgi:hypothetical protein
MDVNNFIKEHGGEILANKLRIHHSGKVVIVARLEGEGWVPTEEGAHLEHELNMRKAAEKPAPKAAPKAAPKTRKKQG